VAILPSILSAVVYFATSALSDRRGLKALIRLHGLVQKNFITPGARLFFVAPGTDMVYNLPLATN
jgi:hypothetical protein